jgi:hypothetical protein
VVLTTQGIDDAVELVATIERKDHLERLVSLIGGRPA